jgi:hypothetical protein
MKKPVLQQTSVSNIKGELKSFKEMWIEWDT